MQVARGAGTVWIRQLPRGWLPEQMAIGPLEEGPGVSLIHTLARRHRALPCGNLAFLPASGEDI